VTSHPPTTTQTRLRQAAVLTAVGVLAAAPYLHYMTAVARRHGARVEIPAVSARQILTTDFVMLMLLLVITSLVGCFLSRRYKLGGLGSRQQLGEALRYVVPGGLIFSAATYLLFGRHFAVEVPGYYPITIGWALVMPIKAALFEETVARFGMMTVLAGLTRRPWLANVLQAVFFTTLNLKTFAFYGVTADTVIYASLVLTLGIHLSLGAIYARYGLIAAALMHLLIDLKFVLHACMA
jgi:hypothetical protein